ncbi:MAG: hypothetical protein ACYDEN_02585 [Acidimicrobiales bacterium]
MRSTRRWAASLPWLLVGILWVLLGAVVLGDPQGLGLIFIGLGCLAFAVSGIARRHVPHVHG